MPARIVTYVGDEPMEQYCANCNEEIDFQNDVCPNGCDEDEVGEVTTTTDFSTKCAILGQMWFQCRDEEQFLEFCEYNDIGLPMAYMIANELVKSTEVSERYINETFANLLTTLKVEQDTGFEDLVELISE